MLSLRPESGLRPLYAIDLCNDYQYKSSISPTATFPSTWNNTLPYHNEKALKVQENKYTHTHALVLMLSSLFTKNKDAYFYTINAIND